MSTNSRSNGQGTPRSRTSMASAASIVQKLEKRSISGRSLGVWANQQYGYRMHYKWNGAFGNHSYERRFKSYRIF
jgi:hypothetical protein